MLEFGKLCMNFAVSKVCTLRKVCEGPMDVRQLPNPDR
jgi:hypothetical protein